MFHFNNVIRRNQRRWLWNFSTRQSVEQICSNVCCNFVTSCFLIYAKPLGTSLAIIIKTQKKKKEEKYQITHHRLSFESFHIELRRLAWHNDECHNCFIRAICFHHAVESRQRLEIKINSFVVKFATPSCEHKQSFVKIEIKMSVKMASNKCMQFQFGLFTKERKESIRFLKHTIFVAQTDTNNFLLVGANSEIHAKLRVAALANHWAKCDLVCDQANVLLQAQ